MKVNGVMTDKSCNTLSDLLAMKNLNELQIVVELNGVIIVRSAYKEKILKDDDIIEIVSFVGGG